MGDLILYAIPFFLLAMGLEYLILRHAAGDHARNDPEVPVGFDLKDTGTSLTMGLGNLFIEGFWKLVVLVVYAGLYTISPVHLSPSDWWSWVLLFFADDLAFYWFHRSHHRIRIFWAMHVVHHSSEHFNLSTALRQSWTPFTSIFFWMPSALFFPPWMVFLAMSWSLLYQFLLHTEAVDRLPRPIEFIFNTPSHHRVHHASQEQYLDKNYGGILIIWDRIFGTFEPEDERARYGLTTNIHTHNPVKVAYGEYVNIWHDLRAAGGWRDRLGLLFKGPGWQPGKSSGSGLVPAETGDEVGVDQADRLHQGVHVGRPDELEAPPV